MPLLLESDFLIQVEGLQDKADDSAITSATVTGYIINYTTDAVIASCTLTHDESTTYNGVVSYQALQSIVDATSYWCEVVAVYGAAQWTERKKITAAEKR